jgi:Tfp pilus assembly protein PilX
MGLLRTAVRRFSRVVTGLRDERGDALVMALGMTTVLAFTLTTTLEMTTAGARHAKRSNADQHAFALAESGLNNAIAVLSAGYPDSENPYPGNGALLPLRSNTFTNGTTWWCGTLDMTLAVWNITSYGHVTSSTRPSGSTVSKSACGSSFTVDAADIVRRMSIVVPVNPDRSAHAAAPVWQWLYAPCDATLTNSGTLNAPFYAGCDLNIQNSLTVADQLYVAGNLTFSGQGHMDAAPMPAGVPQLSVGGLTRLMNTNGRIGTAGTPIADADLLGGCVQKNKTGYPDVGNEPCSWANSSVNIAAGGQNNTTMRAVPVTAPVADWSQAYNTSYPGPHRGCTSQTGTPPSFDSTGSSIRDTSLDWTTIQPASTAAPQNLTPATSYSCKPAGGELSWNATTRVLTVSGNVFIDGSVVIDLLWSGNRNAAYNSVGTIWSSGTILIKNAALCAVPGTGGSCYTSGTSGTGSCVTSGTWDPNKCLLILAANGNGSSGGVQGQVAAGNGIEVKGGAFQGGAFATNSVESATTGQIDGPMITVTGTIKIGQSSVSSFPPINFLNAGAPGDTENGATTLGTPINFTSD